MMKKLMMLVFVLLGVSGCQGMGPRTSVIPVTYHSQKGWSVLLSIDGSATEWNDFAATSIQEFLTDTNNVVNISQPIKEESRANQTGGESQFVMVDFKSTRDLNIHATNLGGIFNRYVWVPVAQLLAIPQGGTITVGFAPYQYPINTDFIGFFQWKWDSVERGLQAQMGDGAGGGGSSAAGPVPPAGAAPAAAAAAAASAVPQGPFTTIPIAFDNNLKQWTVLLGLQFDPQSQNWVWNDFAGPIPVRQHVTGQQVIRARNVGPQAKFERVSWQPTQALNTSSTTPAIREYVWIAVPELLTPGDVLKGFTYPNSPVHRGFKNFFTLKWPGVQQELARGSATAAQPPMGGAAPAAAGAAGILPTSSRHCKPGAKWAATSFPGKTMIYFYESTAPYYEFANFFAAPFTAQDYDGPTSRIWQTSEHYYQGMKFNPATDNNLVEMVRNAAGPSAAFEATKVNTPGIPRWQWPDHPRVRGDWRQISIKVMAKALKAKFDSNPHLKRVLMSTADAIIVEDAGPADRFFGAGGDCNGENLLGIMLMMLRAHYGGAVLDPRITIPSFLQGVTF